MCCPSIAPRASGHIIEQIELVKTILDAGYAYVSNGSVYFDVEKYDGTHKYGVLSGRIIDDMMAGSRELDGQEDKRSPNDFALWKKAAPEHIMRWPSPWSDGFPGWHLECSAMSEKYLGEEFDIHGGGMDLIFPHHECELAQNMASRGKGGVNYWVHNNLITINGQKMGKSKGNFITLEELFAGTHDLLEQPYSPMTIRFFILQAHYRSTLDFSNEALQAAERGLKRLMQATKDVVSLKHSPDAPLLKQVAAVEEDIYQALLDDMNTPIALSSLFEAVRIVNGAKDKGEVLNDVDYNTLTKLFTEIVSDVLGLVDERQDSSAESVIGGLVNMVLESRNAAKAAKNWAESDRIRDELEAIGIRIRILKRAPEWELTK